MKGKAFYCSSCRKRMGTYFSNTSKPDIKKKYKLSDRELSPGEESDSYVGKIEKENTEKFGWIVKIPCRHCGEVNFMNK